MGVRYECDTLRNNTEPDMVPAQLKEKIMREIRPAIMLFLIFTVLCGGIYPATVTTIASLLFSDQAGGSLLTDQDNRVVGSSLIGQPFSVPEYFWSRPSATAGFAYNPLASGGSNYSQTNPDFIKKVRDRVAILRESGVAGTIPAELVEASASGLDPDITPQAAILQIPRVAKARGMRENELQQLVESHTEDRLWGIFGQSRVNVLQLNLALDGKH